jgi:hypothetical protein
MPPPAPPLTAAGAPADQDQRAVPPMTVAEMFAIFVTRNEVSEVLAGFKSERGFVRALLYPIAAGAAGYLVWNLKHLLGMP